MENNQLRKLERAEKLLNDALDILREIRQNATLPRAMQQSSGEDFDASAFLQRIKTVDRGTAEVDLGVLKQSQLGSIFGLAGGSPNDKKKPKKWLVEQILWRLFDFQRGQSAIREEFEKKS